MRLSRHLPRQVATLALVAIYALLIVGTVLGLGLRPPDVMYVDVPERSP
jgi:hypothetical protein